LYKNMVHIRITKKNMKKGVFCVLKNMVYPRYIKNIL
jgi:hypothetical protein